MNSQDMLKMYDYHYWANGQVLKACMSISQEQFAGPNGRHFGSLRGTLAHILDTECKWRTACQAQTLADYVVIVGTDFPTPDDLANRWAQEERTMRAYLAQLSEKELDGTVRLANTDGGAWEQVRWHCLWNIINHATEHRSEASALLTEFGHPPGELDVAEFLDQ